MNKYVMLFKAIRSLLPTGYWISFGSVVEDLEKHPKAIGIIFEGGTPAYRDVSDGVYNMRSAHCLISIVLPPSNDAIFDGYSDAEEILNALESISHYTYTENGSSITILFTETLTDVSQLGFNSNGQTCFSINTLINYL